MDEVSDARQKVIDAARRAVAVHACAPLEPYDQVYVALRDLRNAVAGLDSLQPPGSDAT